MSKKLWGGVFKSGLEPGVESFSASISCDIRLAPYDIEGSIAHARMLAKSGVISEDEAGELAGHLEAVREEILSGSRGFSDGDEDIHMFVEKLLTERAGALAGKLHSGRSRNDQVALDIRLYLRDVTDKILGLLAEFQRTLVDKAEKNLDAVMPGFTHLQHAQAVLFSHHLMAYYNMSARDAGRLRDCRARLDCLPLGSGALAGSSLPLDMEYTADLLGFSSVSSNSMDAVADRDFIIEFIAGCSILMMHLSRLCEEIILWMSPEFGFVSIDESVLTGSSMMPQKKNPDVAELVRGKTGRVYGALVSVLTLMKGLPLAYNRDMQEDKEPLFDVCDTVEGCLGVLPVFIRSINPEKERMRAAAMEGFMPATDLAEHLVGQGVPFRSAHEKSGSLVRFCMENNKKPEELSDQELAGFGFDASVRGFLAPEESVKRKKTAGSTAPAEVKKLIDKAKEELDARV